MVGRELRLVAARIPDRPTRRPGSVDQGVERALGREPSLDEVVDRGGIHQIEPIDVEPLDAGLGGGGVRRVARCRGHRCAGLAQRPGHFQADTGESAGDNHVFAGEVDAGENVIGRRCCRKAAADRMLFVDHGKFPRSVHAAIRATASAPAASRIGQEGSVAARHTASATSDA